MEHLERFLAFAHQCVCNLLTSVIMVYYVWTKEMEFDYKDSKRKTFFVVVNKITLKYRFIVKRLPHQSWVLQDLIFREL